MQNLRQMLIVTSVSTYDWSGQQPPSISIAGTQAGVNT